MSGLVLGGNNEGTICRTCCLLCHDPWSNEAVCVSWKRLGKYLSMLQWLRANQREENDGKLL